MGNFEHSSEADMGAEKHLLSGKHDNNVWQGIA
jgi:hypothetical protein